ncbi:MAG: acyloxyacyl hydrolase [Bacteroidales bacterium]
MGKKPLLLLFIILAIEARTQENNRERRLPLDQTEVFYNSGMIMPHVPAIDFITDEYISSFNINFLKTMDGDKLWENLYRHPNLGFGYYQSSLGNNNIYGKAYSLYGFFEAPLWKINPKFKLNYRMSTGLSFISKTFDIEDNIYNIAIGSHINLHFNLFLSALINITEEYKLITGFSLTHFSNGKIRSPNKGLNVINGSLGVRYYLRQPETFTKDFDEPEIRKKNHFSLIWSNGLKDFNRFKDNVYYISSVNTSYEHQYAHFGKAGVGLDIFYNSALRNFREETIKNGVTNSALYRIGTHLSHDIIVGDFSLTMQLGHYLYNKAFYITDIYNRIGLKYYSNNGMILSLSLKSHNANAEFIEFGIGYLW